MCLHGHTLDTMVRQVYLWPVANVLCSVRVVQGADGLLQAHNAWAYCGNDACLCLAAQ